MTATNTGKQPHHSTQDILGQITKQFWNWSRENNSTSVYLYSQHSGQDYRSISEQLHLEVASRSKTAKSVQQRLKYARLEDIVLLWNEGVSAHAISATLGRSIDTVRQGLRHAFDLGMTEKPYEPDKVAPRSIYSKEVFEEVLRLKDGLGWTQSEVARAIAHKLEHPVTKNMIAGVVRRAREARGEPTNKRLLARERPVKDVKLMIKRVVAPSLSGSEAKDYTDPFLNKAIGVGLSDLSQSHCRAIIGADERGYPVFCGRHKKDGSAYCADHHHFFHRRVPYDYHKQVRIASSYR